MNITDLLIVKRPAILAAAKRWGARNVRVFGSVARGEADAASDIDLLVDLEPGRTLMDLGGLYMELSALLGCELDLVTEGSLQGDFRVTVLREAVEIEALEERERITSRTARAPDVHEPRLSVIDSWPVRACKTR